MKKLLLILMALSFSSILNAQTQLFDFVNSINWKQTESEFVSKCPCQIDSVSHIYNDYRKTNSDYQVSGLALGKYNCTARVYVDSLSRRLHSLSIHFDDLRKDADYFQTSRDMDALLIPILGKPDCIDEDPDSEYVREMDRIWYKDDYIVSVIHMGFSQSQVYSLDIKGIDDSIPDFRKSRWGDSMRKVMNLEGKPNMYDSDDLYVFSSSLVGMPCDVVYVFTDNKLTMTKYMFESKHSNKNEYINDYNRLVRLLTEKYGEPNWNSYDWNNSLYKDEPDSYGFAISLGHLKYSACWDNEKTDVYMILYGENYEISLVIQYTSKKYEQLRKQKSKSEVLDYL